MEENLTASLSLSMIASSSSKWRSLISSFFICVSTSKATRLFIFLSSILAKWRALTAAPASAAAAAVCVLPSLGGLSMDLAGAVVIVLLTLAVVSPSPAPPLVLVVSVCIIIYNCKDIRSLMNQLLVHVIWYTLHGWGCITVCA